MSRKILLLTASLLCFTGLPSFAAAANAPIISLPLAAPQIEQNIYILAKTDSASDTADAAKKTKAKAKSRAKKAKTKAAEKASDTAAKQAAEPRKAKRKTPRKAAKSAAAGAAAGGAVSSAGKIYTPVAGDKNCICIKGQYCIGPRNGHYCYTSGGNKRYLKHD